MRQTVRSLLQAAALAALLPFLALHGMVGVARAVFSGRRRVEDTGELYLVVPYPPGEKSGGSTAIKGLVETLGRGWQLHLVPLYELKPSGGRVRGLLSDWLTFALPMPVHCRPFIVSPSTVRERIGGPHPVVVEFLSGSLFLVFGGRPRNALVLREHEPLCRRLAMETRAARGLGRAVPALKTAAAWLVMFGVYLKVDRVVALTPEDAAYVRRAFPWFARKITDIPVSFDLPEAAPGPASEGTAREMLFVGNFYHRPNVDALRWFLAECARHLDRSWTLHVCGLDEPLSGVVLPASPVQVVRHGFVVDVEDRFAHVRIAVAPVVSGGGVRMKNLFLASRGRAVVTTPLGNEGIGFVPGAEAVVTEDGREMAREIARLAADPDAAAVMGRRARERVRSGFGHDAVLARYRAEVFRRRETPPAAAPVSDPVPAAH
ncbi:MAG TPA: glycosyltransferase family 4 protein [Longimicrobium sp.]|jgi:glycosyltransferase involved in cell wall biosynthesis